jgi:hypothetical protein
MSTKNRKLMDEVHEVMRLAHYSIHTEKTYCDWIKRFILFHDMKSRDDLQGGEPKIEKFLTHLAVEEKMPASTKQLRRSQPARRFDAVSIPARVTRLGRSG